MHKWLYVVFPSIYSVLVIHEGSTQQKPQPKLLSSRCNKISVKGFVCLFGFYGISTIVGYLMPNPLYTYILNIYDLLWLGFMACQPL